MIEINNRRYIGSKTKLISEIKSCIPQRYLNNGFVFADIFAGTGIVAYELRHMTSETIVNDILYCNIVAYKCFFSDGFYDLNKIKNTIAFFNSLNVSKLKKNYFSNVYGGKYFSINDAKKIGYIRDFIEKNKSLYTDREYYMLLTSLLYFTDKIANTCGHFESFLSKKPVDTKYRLDIPNVEDVSNCNIFNEDANKLVRKIECDIAYIDPPYNARQYVNFYHVLENLARWEKPTEFEGNSMKFKRNNLKSGYSKSSALGLMEDLIYNLKAKLILVSYNNTYDAKSGASNNKIQEHELEEILMKKGKLTIKEIDYKYFNAGKTDLKGHKEKIYICEVRNKK